MRLLHTSDWHLGRSLHRAVLRAAQSAFLDHLVDVARAEKVDAVLVAGDVYDRAVPPVDAVELCEDALLRLHDTGADHLVDVARAEKVDAVLVAGDVYDRAVPPVDAVELCEDALLRLHDTGARIVLISGNHDSARRLGFGSGLLEKAGVHVRTRPAALARPVVLEDAHGPLAVYGVPYLEPDAVRGELPSGQDEIPRGHTGVLAHAAGCIRADAEARGIRRRVVMAHGWVSGGAASESERDISVGGVGQVPAELFAGFGYVALGHLHGQQTVAPQMRYSGSPLPYSFSEASHRKGSWLVDLDAAGTARVEQVPAPVYRRLSVLRGRLADLLGSAAYGRYEEDFVSVTLTDPSRPEGAMDSLRARFPHVLVLAFEPEGEGLARRRKATADEAREAEARNSGLVARITQAADVPVPIGDALPSDSARPSGDTLPSDSALPPAGWAAQLAESAGGAVGFPGSPGGGGPRREGGRGPGRRGRLRSRGAAGGRRRAVRGRPRAAGRVRGAIPGAGRGPR